ncbi:MAG TPA: zf-HC2 domain-containing protein [Myxococcaceae bacterium]|nr:zf-HC2 domain-containing protein [Myxococcaceae bacterium]
MQPSLSHEEARRLFGARVDEELPSREEEKLRAHLDACGDCRAGWERYERAVTVVRRVEREKAPPSLATSILRRIRRQRIEGLRGLHRAHLNHRVPMEAALPVLLGIALAVVLMLLAAQ